MLPALLAIVVAMSCKALPDRRNSELQRTAGLAAAASYNVLPASL
jgi:hypothetical protein